MDSDEAEKLFPFADIDYTPYGDLSRQSPYVGSARGTMRAAAKLLSVHADDIVLGAEREHDTTPSSVRAPHVHPRLPTFVSFPPQISVAGRVTF